MFEWLNKFIGRKQAMEEYKLRNYADNVSGIDFRGATLAGADLSGTPNFDLGSDSQDHLTDCGIARFHAAQHELRNRDMQAFLVSKKSCQSHVNHQDDTAARVAIIDMSGSNPGVDDIPEFDASTPITPEPLAGDGGSFGGGGASESWGSSQDSSSSSDGYSQDSSSSSDY